MIEATTSFSRMFFLPFLIISYIVGSEGFVNHRRVYQVKECNELAFCPFARTYYKNTPTKNPITTLHAGLQITNPTPNEAADMGIRDWPQQVKSSFDTEQISEGKTVVRYVLDGEGKLNGNKVGPGTLIEAEGECELKWEISSDNMIILTPGYEDFGKLAGVLAVFVVLCGALIAGVGQ